LSRTVGIVLALAVTTAALGVLTTAVALVAGAVVAGMARGVFTLLQATAVTDRWGRRYYGHLTGLLSAPVTITMALAPFAGAALAGLLGSYHTMFLILCALAAVAGTGRDPLWIVEDGSAESRSTGHMPTVAESAMRVASCRVWPYRLPVTDVERLRLDHRDALLAFELANRDYFAASVPDRGDDYFAHFDERLRELLAEQADGLHHFHVLVDDGEVLGRVNLVDVADGSAELGFRVAEKVAGRGVATAAVRKVCLLARESYGLTSLRADAAIGNIGSRTVLGRAEFVPTGETVVLDGEPGLRHMLRLADMTTHAAGA
jgi:ribosomal-protein-alanine N-acetyltransferase